MNKILLRRKRISSVIERMLTRFSIGALIKIRLRATISRWRLNFTAWQEEYTSVKNAMKSIRSIKILRITLKIIWQPNSMSGSIF